MQQFRTSNVLLNFGNIVVNNINHTSGIFVGENCQFGWSAHLKANHGLGESLGTFMTISAYTVLIFDNDFVDAPIFDNDTIMGNAVDTGFPIPVVPGTI